MGSRLGVGFTLEVWLSRSITTEEGLMIGTVARITIAFSLAIAAGVCARDMENASAGTQGADRANVKAPQKVRKIVIANLPRATRKFLRKAGVSAKTLDLVGTPNLAGNPLAGLALYRAPWTDGGQCVSGVIGDKVSGADCDPTMFSSTKPGYASAGRLGATIIGPAEPGHLPPHALKLLQVYGAATTAVVAVRLIGPTSGITPLPVAAGTRGFVVFGDANPPADGNFVELLGSSGKVLQRIQVAP